MSEREEGIPSEDHPFDGHFGVAPEVDDGGRVVMRVALSYTRRGLGWHKL